MGVIMYNGIQYTGAGGGGSDVTPNPEGSATDILKKLEIEDTIYGISNTIELTQAEYDDLPSSKLTDNILYIIKDAAGASGGNNKTLSGTVAPTAALGDNGDEYIQYHLSSNTPVIDAKYTKVRGQWITYQDDSTIVVPVAPAYSPGDHIDISQSNEISATYGAFQGTDGTDPGSSGLVPAPTTADVDKVLKGDGTWGDASEVEANPSGTATATLQKVDIDGTIYDIQGGGGGGNSEIIPISAGTDTTTKTFTFSRTPKKISVSYKLTSGSDVGWAWNGDFVWGDDRVFGLALNSRVAASGDIGTVEQIDYGADGKSFTITGHNVFGALNSSVGEGRMYVEY